MRKVRVSRLQEAIREPKEKVQEVFQALWELTKDFKVSIGTTKGPTVM